MTSLLDELKLYIDSDKKGMIPALIQVANVATLPGIVGHSLAMPDVHAGYGFAIGIRVFLGNVAAFDELDGIVSPGGIGYDINCGVRLVRTNLSWDQVSPRIEKLADLLFQKIPVGLGAKQNSESLNGLELPLEDFQIRGILEKGMDWALENGNP